MAKNFYVIIPAYNEAKYIGRVIKKVKRYSKNIIVVDDCSTENIDKYYKYMDEIEEKINGKLYFLKNEIQKANCCD